MDFRTVTFATLAAAALAGSAWADDEPLRKSLRAYFTAEDPGERKALEAGIHGAAAGSVGAVLEALSELQLWSAVAEEVETFAVDVGGGLRTDLRVTLPRGYDPAVRYPLVLVLSDSPGRHDAFDGDWFDSLRAEFVVAEVRGGACLGFNAPRQSADAPRAWLRALRRRYHLDSDRVYAYGSGVGGDAAFAMAVSHGDTLAGVVVREGTLIVPVPREMHPILLENLRGTPLHLVWTRPELPPKTLLRGRAVRVAIMNQWITETAERASLPITRSVLPATAIATPDAWDQVLRSRRRAASSVLHWFRYPEQGRAGFLRVDRLAEPVWEGDQLEILTAPGKDRSEFATRTLRAKLGYLSGRIDGQSVDIESARCDSVGIELEWGAVNFTNAVHIRYNGKRRFEGKLSPTMETVLLSAEENWEFQHPACVRLHIGRRGPARTY